MRRKRRKRGTWFPVLGTELGDNDTTTLAYVTMVVPEDGTQTVVVAPITFDDPQDTNEMSVEDPLVLMMGNEYILNSIVGKIFASPRTPGSLNATQLYDAITVPIVVKSGLFVARAEDDAVNSSGDALPIGAKTLDATISNYSPLSINTVREPWIWQRTWILNCTEEVVRGAGAVGPTTSEIQGYTAFAEKRAWGRFPPTTAAYHSLNEGGHIHTKTKRRIRQDERLWWAAACHTWPPQQELTTGTVINLDVGLDVRIHAGLVKAHNRSAF